MSTKRISQEIVDVEVTLPAQRYVSQVLTEAEVTFPSMFNISQVIVNVEVETAYRLRVNGPAAQIS